MVAYFVWRLIFWTIVMVAISFALGTTIALYCGVIAILVNKDVSRFRNEEVARELKEKYKEVDGNPFQRST